MNSTAPFGFDLRENTLNQFLGIEFEDETNKIADVKFDQTRVKHTIYPDSHFMTEFQKPKSKPVIKPEAVTSDMLQQLKEKFGK